MFTLRSFSLRLSLLTFIALLFVEVANVVVALHKNVMLMFFSSLSLLSVSLLDSFLSILLLLISLLSLI